MEKAEGISSNKNFKNIFTVNTTHDHMKKSPIELLTTATPTLRKEIRILRFTKLQALYPHVLNAKRVRHIFTKRD